MSNDEKSTGKKAGGFSKFKQQYGQLGGNKHRDSEESESQEAQASKRLDVQPVEHTAVLEVKTLDSQHANHSDAQLSGHQAIQPSGHSTIEPSKSQNTGESGMPNIQAVEHLEVQQSRSKQQRDKLTVYLEPDLNDWVRQRAIIEKRLRGHHVEISDIINEALRKAKEG